MSLDVISVYALGDLIPILDRIGPEWTIRRDLESPDPFDLVAEWPNGHRVKIETP